MNRNTGFLSFGLDGSSATRAIRLLRVQSAGRFCPPQGRRAISSRGEAGRQQPVAMSAVGGRKDGLSADASPALGKTFEREIYRLRERCKRSPEPLAYQQ